MMLLATLTANSSSSLQFTNIPNNYNSWLLNCTGLLGSVSGTTLKLEVGESTGFETSAHYTESYASVTTASDLIDGLMPGLNTATDPAWIQVFLDNPGVSGVIKPVAIFFGGGESGSSTGDTYLTVNTSYIGGWWNSDTNPITGIELVANSTHTITSGSCSLYGLF